MMIVVATAGAMIALALLGAIEVVQARARTRGDPNQEDPRGLRRQRATAFAILTALVLCPPLVATLVVLGMEQPLAVPLPERPESGTRFDLDLDLTGVLAIMIGGAVLAWALLVSIAAAVGGRPGAVAHGVPNGRLIGRVGHAALAAAAVLVIGRIALGGHAPREFPFGALTPGYVAGWRAEQTVARRAAGPARPIPVGTVLESDERYVPGSDCCGGLAHPGGIREITGTKAWIVGRPVAFTYDDATDTLLLRPVARRDESRFPRRNRPHFDGPPLCAPAAHPYAAHVLIDKNAGTLFAVLLWKDGNPVGAMVSDVGLLLQPPWWPALLLGTAFAAAKALRRAARDKPSAGVVQLAAGALLLIASAIATAGLVAYF